MNKISEQDQRVAKMTKQQLQRLKELGDKATQGPWEHKGGFIFHPEEVGDGDWDLQLIIDSASTLDAIFVMEARNNWNALIQLAQEGIGSK